VIWDASDLEVHVDEESFRAREPLPLCPRCSDMARPNILMFGDYSWNDARSDEQQERFIAWMSGQGAKNLAVIEIGAGTAIPSVRRLSESLQAQGATLIRINPREPEGPGGTISIASGAFERAGEESTPTSQVLEAGRRYNESHIERCGMRRTSRSSHRGGFSRAEVAGALGVAGAIAGPSGSGWRPRGIAGMVFGEANRSKGAVCQSNLKQMGIALMQYTQDYDELYPRASFKDVAQNSQSSFGWANVIQPYLKSNEAIQCPSGEERALRGRSARHHRQLQEGGLHRLLVFQQAVGSRAGCDSLGLSHVGDGRRRWRLGPLERALQHFRAAQVMGYDARFSGTSPLDPGCSGRELRLR
jgi:NAD-dependent SIR2 family protein deacetylase